MKESEEVKRLKTEKFQRMEALKKEKRVKIKALRPIRPWSTGGIKIFQPGDVLDLPESEAKEFCETSFNGYSGESGLKNSKYAQAQIVRAEYVPVAAA